MTKDEGQVVFQALVPTTQALDSMPRMLVGSARGLLGRFGSSVCTASCESLPWQS
jgi:hypothetical protein